MFNLIERDGLTPQDHARMKDEYNLEEVKPEEYRKDITAGTTVGTGL